MSHPKFQSPTSSRNRSGSSKLSVGILALGAFLGLTGAKGGCLGEVITGCFTPVPDPEPCGPGEELLEVCVSPPVACLAEEGCPDLPTSCELKCVPSAPCGEGYHLETVCEAYALGAPDCGPNEDCALPPPPEPTCYEECVPDDVCPDGSHLETVCEDIPLGAPECAPGQDCIEPEPACFDTCVPDGGDCGPGYRLEEHCDAPVHECAPDELCPEPHVTCSLECVPEGCPPGYHEELECVDFFCVEEDHQSCSIVCVEDFECDFPGEPEPHPGDEG